MTRIESAKNKTSLRDVAAIAFFLLLVLLVWALVKNMASTKELRIHGEAGICDLRNADFDEAIYVVDGDAWDIWAERLYAPADFADGITGEPTPPSEIDYAKIQYATHRTTLLLQPGITYGISTRSSDYSMRLFIGGEQFDLVGVPGTTKEETVPRTLERAYYFTAREEHTEIVIQAANFVHWVGAYIFDISVGSYRNISQQR